MKFLAGFLTLLSSLFIGKSPPKSLSPLPLNTAIIAYSNTYFAPVVVEPGNFPWANKLAKEIPLIPVPVPPPPTPLPPIPISLQLAPSSTTTDKYLAYPEPIGINWLHLANFPDGHILPIKGSGDQTLSGFITDREYWRIDVNVNWISPNPQAKLPAETDFFKLGVYEEGSNKLIYEVASRKEESLYKVQIFQKPGKYYFKIYGHPYGHYEIDFFSSPKIVQR